VIHEKHVQWLETRGISAGLAAKFGLESVLMDGANWLAVPYVECGQTVNHKYRLTSEKRHQMDQGAPLTLWNHDCLIEDTDKPLVICEGEWDAMTALSLGWRAVSVPNGAPAHETADVANAPRYDFNKVPRFILATDDDGPGRALRADLAAMLGADRCSFIDYPFPTKDLNEVLLEYGSEAVSKALNNAKSYPVRGLYRLSDFPETPPVRGVPIGIDCMADKIEIVPGTLTVFTGYSNMGKSTVMNTVIAHAIDRGASVCVASFETAPKPILRDGIARAMLGCAEYEFGGHPDRRAAYDTLEARLTIITNALDEDLEFDIDAFLERAKIAVVRDGTRFIVLDPWNELEHKRQRDESLSEYVGRAIRAVKRFARAHNVAVWIVAHPTKPQKGTNQIPSLYDVSDSANWANKADYGLVYHRRDKTVNEAQLAVVKVRMGLPGECCVASVTLDYRAGRVTGAHQ
jgi:twinkle protein